MAIRTLPSRAIADASIQAVDIANSSISKAKIDADTRLGLQNDSIILDGTDGAGANKGDFLVLDGTDNSSTNANDRILFDETFIDKVNLFNINTLGSANQQLRVNSGGSALEFATISSGTHEKLSSSTVSTAVSEINFANIFADNSSFRVFYILGEGLEGSAGAYRNWRFSTDGSSGDTGNYSWTIDGYASNNVSISWYTTATNYASMQDDSYYAVAGYAYGFNGYVNIPTKTDVASYFSGLTYGEQNSNRTFFNNFVGASHSTTTPTGIIFYNSSGNFTDGTITVYGVNQ